MASWSLADQLGRPWTVTALFAGAVGLTAALRLLFFRPRRRHSSGGPTIIPSPLQHVLANYSPEEQALLPYPPDILPGRRAFATPYGTINVYEFGRAAGEKVLLLHGISTPCLALADLARRLADAGGHRVMLFDLFGRGYSDAPASAEYDTRLYLTQVLLVLASSPLPGWTGDAAFHLVGFSLGGGLAAALAAWLPRMLRSLVVVANGGLIRPAHIGWLSRALYGTAGGGGGSRPPLLLLPRALRAAVAKGRLRPDVAKARPRREEAEREKKGKEGGGEEGAGADTNDQWHHNIDATGGSSFDYAQLSRRRPGYTVADVVAWQVDNHAGFVHAFMSTMRHAPIYGQQEDWAKLGALLAERRRPRAPKEKEEEEVRGADVPPGLQGGKMLFVLGTTDPIIVKDELIQDAREVLGEDGFEVHPIDSGHEVGIARGDEVADAAMKFWSRHRVKN